MTCILVPSGKNTQESVWPVKLLAVRTCILAAQWGPDPDDHLQRNPGDMSEVLAAKVFGQLRHTTIAQLELEAN